ncbi:MAG: LysR family transcriptional regulator [Desulfobacterales bacterium]|nr:LysR family transcriptional regulator [Desulfobacterales bacterium]
MFSLKVFLTVAEKQSFSGAAETLFLTQPAVSSQVQNLENYFQTPLVIRPHSGAIKLTDAGKIVCDYADKFVVLGKELLRDIEKQTGKSMMQLRLGACFIAGAHLVPAVMKAFVDKHPTVDVSLNVTRCEDIFQGLLSGSLDIGIAGLSPKNKFLIKKKFYELPLTIFEAGNAQKQCKRVASIRELIGSSLIIREKGAGTRKSFQEFLNKHHVNMKDFQLISVSESNEAIKRLVMTGMGFSVLPHFIVKNELKDGRLSEVRLKEGALSQSFFVIYRKQSIISRSQQDFLEFILKAHTAVDSIS